MSPTTTTADTTKARTKITIAATIPLLSPPAGGGGWFVGDGRVATSEGGGWDWFVGDGRVAASEGRGWGWFVCDSTGG